MLVNVASERKAGTEQVYSARTLEPSSCKNLHEWLNDQHVPNPLPQSKLHCSVVCACTELPADYIPDRRHILVPPETYSLGTIGPAFALFFQSWQLELQWKSAVERGVTMVYSTFVPHVSLSYSVLVDWDYSALVPPNFRLEFQEEIVSKFDPTYKQKS